MQVEVVANQHHRGVIERLLEGRPFRVRLYALHVHDVQLISSSLGLRLIRLLGSDCTVTVAFGDRLWDTETGSPRNELCRQVLDFLKEIEDYGANVWHVPDPLLHAKVLYVEEEMPGAGRTSRALVSSANFTETGIGGSNFELGIGFEDLEACPILAQSIKKFTDGVLGAARPIPWEGV